MILDELWNYEEKLVGSSSTEVTEVYDDFTSDVT